MPKTLQRLAATLTLCLLTISAAGCASGPATSCLPWQPIRPTAEDVDRMSDVLVSQILAHNETGRAVCGW